MNRLPNDRPPCPRLTSHTIETPLPECRHKRTCPPDRPMSAEPPAVQLAGYRIAGRMPCPDEDRNAGRIVRGGPDRMAQCRRPYRPPAARRTVDPVPDHSCIASCVWSKCVRGITNSGSEAPSHGRTEKSNGPRKERRLPKRPLPVRPVLPRCCPPLVRNCTGETSSALLSQPAHDTGPADRSGMTKRSPPRSSGHSVWSIRATSGPASGAGRTSGRAAYSETVAGVRLQGSLSAMHAGTCRDIGADPG